MPGEEAVSPGRGTEQGGPVITSTAHDAAAPSSSKEPFAPEEFVDSPLFGTDQFRLFCHKVLPCAKRYRHDWTICPFAHPGEKAKRRDPRVYEYVAVACPDVKHSKQCPRGEACTYAHNVFEYWLHPSRYRTLLCKDGTNCRRKVCFFAHSASELRLPTDVHGNAIGPVLARSAVADMATVGQLFGTNGGAMALVQEGPGISAAAAVAAAVERQATAAMQQQQQQTMLAHTAHLAQQQRRQRFDSMAGGMMMQQEQRPRPQQQQPYTMLVPMMRRRPPSMLSMLMHDADGRGLSMGMDGGDRLSGCSLPSPLSSMSMVSADPPSLPSSGTWVTSDALPALHTSGGCALPDMAQQLAASSRLLLLHDMDTGAAEQHAAMAAQQASGAGTNEAVVDVLTKLLQQARSGGLQNQWQQQVLQQLHQDSSDAGATAASLSAGAMMRGYDSGMDMSQLDGTWTAAQFPTDTPGGMLCDEHPAWQLLQEAAPGLSGSSSMMGGTMFQGGGSGMEHGMLQDAAAMLPTQLRRQASSGSGPLGVAAPPGLVRHGSLAGDGGSLSAGSAALHKLMSPSALLQALNAMRR